MQRVFIITHALTLALGASLLHSWQAESRVWAADKKIERLQADLRTASGKVYDMQEQEQDKLDAAHGAGFTEAYEACKRGDIK